MSEVWVVVEHSGEYSQASTEVKAVFSSAELAHDYAAKMAALPGITAEYGPGSENDYAVIRMPVWTEPTERMVVYHQHDYIDDKGRQTDLTRSGYRSEEYAPAGYGGFFSREIRGPDASGWGVVSVAAPSEEERSRIRAELLAEYRERRRGA